MFSILGFYETSVTEIEAGQPVTSPPIKVGSVGGKALYATVTLSTTA
jgi:hypothetical protein